MITASGLDGTQIRKDFPILAQTTSRGKRLVYLDSAATSQKPQTVIDTLDRYYREYNANIHRGVYEIAARATDCYEAARTTVAEFIGAQAREIIFTRNATESINLVAYTWGEQNIRRGDVILISELEHHSNMVPWIRLCQRKEATLRYIPVSDDGQLVLDNLDQLLQNVKLVAVTHVSNTLGTIVPISEIIARAHALGALVLIDGAQAAPHLAVNVAQLDADFYAFSGHKMLGPTGIGALFGKRTILESMDPFLFGGDMIGSVGYHDVTFNEIPHKFEAGTASIADAIGFGEAITYLKELGIDAVREHERDLTAYALGRLASLESRGLVIYGPRDPNKISGAISFNFADVHAHDLASILDTQGVCIRAGHHCTMPLMDRMGWPATARASFYVYNDRDDVEVLIEGLQTAASIFKL